MIPIVNVVQGSTWRIHEKGRTCEDFCYASTTIARCELLNAIRTSFRSLQRDRAEARFSERLPIGPPWRLRGRVSLILAGAPEDKQTSVLCYWRGAEPAEAFTKASVLSHSYSPPPFHPIASYSSHIHPLTLISALCFSLFLSLSCSYLNLSSLSLSLSFLRLPSMIVQSKVLNERGSLLHDLGHNNRKFFLSKILSVCTGS